jgi:hypothetical protein
MLQHSFDEEEWFVARDSLICILSSDQKHADENSIRSYISCCAEAVGGSFPLPSLSDSVVEFYNQYGMDSAQRNTNQTDPFA